MANIFKTKDLVVTTTVFLSALVFLSPAQAQQGNDSGGNSSSPTSSSSGQSSQKPRSNDQSNAADRGEEREKMDRNVKDTVKRDKDHNLKPSEYDPPK